MRRLTTMLGKIRNSKKLIAMLPITLIAIAALSFTPLAHAYGSANFQAGFAGTGVLKGNGQQFGFWGWCDFAGGTGSPATAGNEADCVSNNYFQTPGGRLQVQISVQGTAWDEEACSFPPCATGDDFFITAGTVTLSGPFVLVLEQSGPPPPVCTAAGTVVTCPISFLESVGFYNPDTGIPTVPGHYALLPAFGIFGSSVFVGQFQLDLIQLS
jgi:hypothetical protein